MKTREELLNKLKELEKNTNLTNLAKNLHWKNCLKWVLEIKEEDEF